MSEIKLYQPSNGSEGDWFTTKFCMQCKNCDPDPVGNKQCNILCSTFFLGIKDPDYPREWTYDKEGNPTCTAHIKWDWAEQGDPDDPDNPNHIPPIDPNQMNLF